MVTLLPADSLFVKNITSGLLKTIAYADIFDYPLLDKEIWRYLIGTKTNLFQFQKGLKSLINRQKIDYYQGFYILKTGRRHIFLRKKRQKIALRKIIYARKAAQIIKTIPSVWLVGISGALAMNNVSEQDDIDLFIITSPHLMWLTRFLVTAVFDFLGWRRKPNADGISNKICLNMFLDADRLSLPKFKQNLYTAHEIAQLKILFNKHEVYEHFLFENRWVEKYLPQAVIFSQKIKPYKKKMNNLLVKLELFLRRVQLLYMAGKRTTEIILPNLIQFHPQDSQFWIDLAYKKRLKDLHLKHDT